MSARAKEVGPAPSYTLRSETLMIIRVVWCAKPPCTEKPESSDRNIGFTIGKVPEVT